jgi:hypothetical protein
VREARPVTTHCDRRSSPGLTFGVDNENVVTTKANRDRLDAVIAQIADRIGVHPRSSAGWDARVGRAR